MPFSYKIKRLLLVSVAVVILAIAANDGTKELQVPEKPLRQPIPYPQVPLDLDPNALITETQTFVTTQITPSPVPVVPRPRSVISSEAYLVAHLDTGEVYVEHATNRMTPIASLSKLITALVALHHMNHEQKITMTQPMLDAYGEAGKLTLGETFTVRELLYPLLLESSNDAAEALAQSYGYNEFIQKMNEFVANLGMTSTSFRDASGLSSGNISNARDLFLLAQYLYAKEKSLLELTRQTSFAVASTTEHTAHVWKTINPFPYDPHFMGGKTGRTIEAKESMISLFRYSVDAVSYPVAIIVLRSDFSNREVDSSMLFERFIRTVDSSI